MSFHILHDKGRVSIGVAISAQVTAGIVGSYIRTEKARAFTIPLFSAISGDGEITVKSGLIGLNGHAS